MSARASFGLLFALVFACPTALAQPALTPKAAAQESYGKGLRLANQADAKGDPALFEAAYLQFAQAYAIYPDDKVLWNLAASELRTKRFVEALRHFRSYDEHQHVAMQGSHPDHARFIRLIAEAEAATGRVTVEAPRGSEVRIDGKVVGVAPLATPINVMPGTHAVEAQAGNVVMRGSVQVEGGRTGAVTLGMQATAVPIVSAPVLETVPSAPVKAEDHTARDVLRWTTVGVAVVGVAVGVGFYAAERSQASDFTSFQSAHPRACAASTSATCAHAHSQYSEISQRGDVSGVGFVVGGVAAATSAALWLFWPKPAATATTSWLSPNVGAGLYAIELGGHF